MVDVTTGSGAQAMNPPQADWPGWELSVKLVTLLTFAGVVAGILVPEVAQLGWIRWVIIGMALLILVGFWSIKKTYLAFRAAYWRLVWYDRLYVYWIGERNHNKDLSQILARQLPPGTREIQDPIVREEDGKRKLYLALSLSQTPLPCDANLMVVNPYDDAYALAVVTESGPEQCLARVDYVSPAASLWAGDMWQKALRHAPAQTTMTAKLIPTEDPLSDHA